MLDVYTWEPNMNAGKPLLALTEKGVPFRYHYIDLAKREQHSPAFLQINPNGTVPALVHHGRVLTESTRAALSTARLPDPRNVFAPGPELARWG